MTEDAKYATHHELGLMQGFPPPPDKRVKRGDAILGFPAVRWSYQNMRKLFPTANITPSSNPCALTMNPDGNIARLPVPHADGTVDTFETFLKETYTDAYVVIKGDEIVFERYMNGMGPDQPHQMNSCTKSFTGLLALMSADEGLISEDELPTRYIPALESAGAFAEATIGQIFDMTNSMAFDEDYDAPDSDIKTYGRVVGLIDEVPGEPLIADNVFDYVTTLQKGEYEHGEVFHYCTPKTEVVNWIVNMVTGRSYEENMSRLFEEIGAEGETYIILDRNANLIAGGGLNATPRNLARFAMMMLNDGKVAGRQVVPLSVIETIERGGSEEAFLAGPDALGNMRKGGYSYRAQWWVRTTEGRETINAIGINGQWISIDRKRGLAVIKQSSQPDSVNVAIDDFTLNAFDAIRSYYSVG